MKRSLLTAYRHLLETVATNPRHFTGHQLVAFHPTRGPGPAVDTMYIGRALNGWHWDFQVEICKMINITGQAA